MILVFDAGNTETVMGLIDGEELVEHWRLSSRTDRTADELGLLVRSLVRESGFEIDRIQAAVIASVVPPLTAVLIGVCDRHLGTRPHTIDARSHIPVRLEVDEPLSVGADRIVNTLAASVLYGRDSIVVDLGTATTFDCITADGAFIGGVIAPGMGMGAEALVRRTAKLPRVDLERPDSVIGKRTEVSVQSGIFFSSVAAIDGIVDRIIKEWQPQDPVVVATGGLAPAIATHCRSVDRVEPFLTLRGLGLAYRHLTGA